jgi:KaiC/GvpD/RAD55 family RecA-like ATPase
MGDREVGAFEVNSTKLTLKTLRSGTYIINPQVVYVDDAGEEKTYTPHSITVTANPHTPKENTANKISSGTPDLNQLLLGGIPKEYAIALTAPSSDERQLLIKRFLEAGAKADETTFYLTVEAEGAKALAEKHQSNFYLFLFNPRADAMIRSFPNVTKLKGVENLTEVDIALTKAFRSLDASPTNPRRVCVEILSDILLQHQAVITRKWLSALLADLKSHGFTTIAVIDPRMHPQEELHAVLNLFDGEINITEKETAAGLQQILRVRRLCNQKYLESELLLPKERDSNSTANLPEGK